MQIIPFYEVWVFYPLNAIVTIALSLSLCYIGKRILSKYSWLIAL